MAKSETKNRSLRSVFMLVFVLALSLLVVIEIGANVANEIRDQNEIKLTMSNPDSGLGGNAERIPTLFEMRPLE